MGRIKIAFVLTTLLALVFQAGCRNEVSPTSDADLDSPPVVDPEPEGVPVAVIVTVKGEISVRLRPDLAPETIKRFIELAEVGFYSRTTFHRVLKDQMIQGGDPLSRDSDPYNDGQGTSGAYLPVEFSQHEFDRGTVAMGRTAGGDNGGSCQFFIVLRRSPEWDGQYNAFGEVLDGIEVAEEISRAPLTKDPHPLLKNRPAGKQLIERVRIEYRDLETEAG